MIPSRQRILVVENDKPIRTMLELLLELEDFDVRGVSDGAEALRSDPTWQPDVIVLDLMMPIMDGREFLAQRAQVSHLASVPVVVVSASPDGLSLARDPTVSGVLVKPHDVRDLLAAIARALTVGRVLTERR